MFSGLIGAVGKIITVEPMSNGLIVGVDNKKISAGIKLGSSVAVSGVCLSVLKKKSGKIFFEVMPETISKTTWGEKKIGEFVNLERSLRFGDEMGGHMVFGHVDGVGRVTKIEKIGANLRLTISPPVGLLEFFCPQGSVALDGVSLTIAELGEKTITVALITDTIKKTTLGKLAVGDVVNIECDMLAKYVTEQMKKTITN